jgi:hypothetical protein
MKKQEILKQIDDSVENLRDLLRGFEEQEHGHDNIGRIEGHSELLKHALNKENVTTMMKWINHLQDTISDAQRELFSISEGGVKLLGELDS